MSLKVPKGKHIAIGGNEDKGTYNKPALRKKYYLNFFELGILKRIITELKGIESQIEIITTASMIPLEVGEMYTSAFKILGCPNIRLMHIREEGEPLQEEYLERIKKADGVMFSGGDQTRLTRIFGGTEFLKILCHRYWEDKNFLIAGTSAGAMVMSEIMIRGGSAFTALMKGSVKIGEGFGLIQDVVIDSHFVKRGRFSRLIEAVAANPNTIGIGLGEDTGVLITEGNMIETIGSNLVAIIDGHTITHNNKDDIQKGRPLSIANITMHVLAKGNAYNISNRQFLVESPVPHKDPIKPLT
jgi:cyanophycinase